MGAISRDAFDKWLDTYGKASKENDPKSSSELFAEDAMYYESPFDDPMTGRDAIYRYWSTGAQAFKDKDSSHEILALEGNRGIARWQSRYTRIESGERFALDCIFLVDFNENGLCSVFREWWHSSVLPSSADA